MTQSQLLDDVAADAAVQRRIQPTYGYYRQKNGWITISPITRLERINYIERGWEHLGQYGAFDMTPYVVNHPLDALFMFGGAHELPVEQIIQMGLAFDPPIVPRCKQHITQYHRSHNAICWQGATPVVFPQLASVSAERLGPFACEFCSRKLPTPDARRQHQIVAHKDELGNLQTGKSLGDSLAAALQQQRQPDAGTSELSELRAQLAALQKQLNERPVQGLSQHPAAVAARKARANRKAKAKV